MKVWYLRKDDDVVIVNVDPFTPARQPNPHWSIIQVFKSRDLDSREWLKANLHWQSNAAQDPARAKLMASGLLLAVRIAAQLDRGLRPKYQLK